MSEATVRAANMIPATAPLHGGSVGDSVLDNARALLARIKAGLGRLAAQGFKATVDADATALRKAASVLGAGARQAAKFAGQVKDDVAKDLGKLARDAYDVAVGPAMIVLGLLLLSTGGEAKTGDNQTWLLAGLAWAASRGLL